MRVSVCEAPAVMNPGSEAWRALVVRTRIHDPDIVLLNEMPFGAWIATEPEPDRDRLVESHRLHEDGLASLQDLQAETVLSTRAVVENGQCVNQGFVWSSPGTLTPVHEKQFFPDEAGFYEARWYRRGTRRFHIGEAAGLRVGFLICTDVMFLEWARHYGRQKAHLIAVPRATPLSSVERWKTVIRTAAIVSGCYVASSNRSGVGASGIEFAGRGWIVHPSGDVIAATTEENPVAVADIDPAAAERAQTEYPCYVEDLGS